MKMMTRILAMAVTGIFVAGVAHAVKPAYVGRLGNPEEPALRPFKAMWPTFVISLFEREGAGPPSRPPRTLATPVWALVYQTWTSLKQGNEKVPILGSIEVGRGFGRGLVEYYSRMGMALAGSVPRPYKEMGKANQIMENDALLRNTRDMLGYASLAGVASDGLVPCINVHAPKLLNPFEYYSEALLALDGPYPAAVKLAPGAAMWGTQKVFDQDPLNKMHRTAVKVHDTLELDTIEPPSEQVEDAQKKYLGKRALNNNKRVPRNLLKLAR